MNIKKEIVKRIIEEKVNNLKDLNRIKGEVAKKYKADFPTNTDLLQSYHKTKGKDERVLALLRTRPVRSLSGVVNISVLTKPFPCPGKCIYCPLQEGAPKSYLKNEPAVMRAVANNYRPLSQVKNRIASLKKTGHPTNKIELRIVGGTWSFYSEKYQINFIKKCFDACNGKISKNLKEAQKTNEKAEHRIICLSIETRPDFITKEEILRLRSLGVTMVELGVQSLYDDVLDFNQRGHKVEDTKIATKLLEDSGFKVCYQVMLNLPKSTIKKDIDTFQRLFSDSSFRPDFLKIYPCAVLKEAPLHSLWKEGKYHPFREKDLIEIIKKVKKDIIPRYVRIQRLFRDIPSQSIIAGSKISNLRENIVKEAKKEGWKCNCIRCREIKADYNPQEKLELFREDYSASGGKEVLLSVESSDRGRLFAILRLRKTSSPFLSTLKGAGVIREIHTYGQQLLIKNRDKTSPQHKGLGKKLIKIAERITKEEFKQDSIAVISGVGARDYWRNNGYRLRSTYMIKKLS